jgi:hypothetical protein
MHRATDVEIAAIVEYETNRRQAASQTRGKARLFDSYSFTISCVVRAHGEVVACVSRFPFVRIVPIVLQKSG